MSRPNITLAVGQELRRMRKQARIHIKPWAGKLGISPSSLSAYERGTRPITTQRLYEMCRALDVDPAEVLRVAIEKAEGTAEDGEA